LRLKTNLDITFYQKTNMATTADIRNGLCIEFNDDIFQIIEFQHAQVGRGAAHVKTKIRSMTTGRVLEYTFTSGHKINEVRIERRKFQFLYADEMGYNFMNNDTFDQVSIEEKLISSPKLLKEGMEVDILFHAEKETPLTLEMPQYVVMQVTYTEPGLRGDTATNTLKPATVESGAEVRVPLFVGEGDFIKIDTASGAYMERVKQ
jgi:elongation factor P